MSTPSGQTLKLVIIYIVYISKHLMNRLKGNWEFCFLDTLYVEFEEK